MFVHAVDQTGVAPLQMPDQFRTQIVYFMTPGDEEGVPPLGADEYFIRRENAQKWLDEYVVEVVSPLDAAAVAQVELTEEQEDWLQWMVDNQIEHVRLAK